MMENPIPEHFELFRDALNIVDELHDDALNEEIYIGDLQNMERAYIDAGKQLQAAREQLRTASERFRNARAELDSAREEIDQYFLQRSMDFDRLVHVLRGEKFPDTDLEYQDLPSKVHSIMQDGEEMGPDPDVQVVDLTGDDL